MNDPIDRLLDGIVTDVDGQARPLTVDDIIVVTPYNANVRCIKHELGLGHDAGDRGRNRRQVPGPEAYVVF